MVDRGPEEQKLLDYINTHGVVQAHVWWGPEAAKLTREERAAAINKFLAGKASELDFGDSTREPGWARPPMTIEEFLKGWKSDD